MLKRLVFLFLLAVVLAVILGGVGLLLMSELGPIFAGAFIIFRIAWWLTSRGTR